MPELNEDPADRKELRWWEDDMETDFNRLEKTIRFMQEMLLGANEILGRLAAEAPTQFGEECMHWCGLCGKGLAMQDQPETHEPNCLYVADLAWMQESELKADAFNKEFGVE